MPLTPGALPERPDRPDRRGARALLRYGPMGVLIVVLALAGVLVAVNDDRDDGNDAGAERPRAVERPAGAVSFTQAQAEGLDVVFPDSCDEATGKVAMPWFFAAECYADVADNGGATSRGVTADTITVVAYLPPESDPIIGFITAAIGIDDSPDDIRATYQGYADLFGSLYQTYGRRVELKFLQGSGTAIDEVAARADAVKAAEEMGAFAAWGGPQLTDAWADELAARGVVSLSFVGGTPEWMEERAPYLYVPTANGEQVNTHVAEYLSKQVAGRPAEHAGDPAFRSRERVFGHLWLEQDADSRTGAEALETRLADAGVDVAASVPYALDPARLQEQATSAITRLKAAGVTSVILRGDPIAPGSFTREATAQRYFPEWILGGSALADVSVFGRIYDQEQWAHAFGVTTLAARVAPEVSQQNALYEWFHGTPPPADETAGLLFPHPALFFSALQAAGPNLTPETFRDGLFTSEPTAEAVTQPSLSFGDHGLWPFTDWNGIDDATEIWWDPDAVGPDEVGRDGTGLYRFVEGGRRHLPGAWPERDSRAFDPSGTVTIYDEPPPAEAPPTYPRPVG